MYDAVSINGVIYRVKTTMQEFAPNEKRPNVPHGYDVTKIEVLKQTNTSTGAQATIVANGSNVPLGTTKLLKGIEKSYEKEKNFWTGFSNKNSLQPSQKCVLSDFSGYNWDKIIIFAPKV